MSVRILDRKVRRSFLRLEAQAKGKKRFPTLERFIKWKRKRLLMPWEKKGIDERGGTNKWPSNERSTTLKKFGKKLEQEWINRDGIAGPMTPEFMKGGGFMRTKRITAAQRRAKILEESGAMKKGIRVRKSSSKKSGKMTIVIDIKGPAKKYAYYQLHGARNQTRVLKGYRWVTESGRRLPKPIKRTTNFSVPPRPWGVWTDADLAQFAKELEKDIAKAI